MTTRTTPEIPTTATVERALAARSEHAFTAHGRGLELYSIIRWVAS